MTNEELNTALHEKMFAEQETYRAWLLGAVRGSILWAIMKSLVMVFPPIKQDAVLPGGILLHTNFLRICSFLLCKHPYKFYLKIVSKKLLRDDL